MAEPLDDEFFTGEPTPEVEPQEQAGEPTPDEPTEPQPTDTEPEPVATGGGEEPTEEPAQEGPDPYAEFSEKPALVEAMKHIADRVGHLDPSDPEHIKTIRAMAEKDLMIQRYRAAGDDTLTEYEKSFQEGGDAKPKGEGTEPKPEVKTEPSNREPTSFEDVTRDWRSFADSAKALNDAWNAEGGPDYQRVADITQAQTQLMAEHMILPQVQQMVQGMLQQTVGPYEPMLQQQQVQQMAAANQQFAVAEVSKLDGFEDIPELLQRGESGEPSPADQVLQAVPHIKSILIEGRNFEETDRLTRIAQLKAVKAEWLRMQNENQYTQKAVKAGKAIAAREQQQAARQAVNSGSGTGQIDGGAQERDIVDEIVAGNMNF